MGKNSRHLLLETQMGLELAEKEFMFLEERCHDRNPYEKMAALCKMRAADILHLEYLYTETVDKLFDMECKLKKTKRMLEIELGAFEC